MMTGPVELALVLMVGLAFGSFASMLVYRIPRDLPWINLRRSSSIRSACPHCGAALTARDLIPLFSWLFLKGKCRHCRAPIGWIYPVTEGLTLFAVLGFYSAYGLSFEGIALLCAAPLLVALLMIDVEHMILPDVLVLALGMLAVIFYVPVILDGAGAGLVVVLIIRFILYGGLLWLLGQIMKIVLKRDALGFGDVKFFAVAGMWLGVWFLPAIMVLAGVAGLVWGGISRLRSGNPYFPFGPALIMAFYVCLMLRTPEGMAMIGAAQSALF